jgi:WD40 repeat protein
VAAVAWTQIIHNWEAQDAPVHLRTIRDRLLQGEERHRGRLLGLVQAIHERGGIPTDASREQMQLRLTGLVVPRDGQLRITNPIYAAVFSSDWVCLQLRELRPPIYSEAIQAWEAAPPEERPSHLISGAALREALGWAKGKRLSDGDQEFLEASRAEEERTRLAAEQARLAEERAARAEERARDRKRWNWALGMGLASMTLLALFAWLMSLASRHHERVSDLQAEAIDVLSGVLTSPVERLISALAITSEVMTPQLEELSTTGYETLLTAVNSSDQWVEVNRLEGHSGWVNAVAISRDGMRIASGGDKTVRLWSGKNGSQIRKLDEWSPVLAVAMSDYVGKVVSGTENGDGWIRDVDALYRRKRLVGHHKAIKALAISADGQLIVSGSVDKSVRRWEGRGGQALGPPLIGHTNEVLAVAITPDGRRIVSGSKDGTVRLWDGTNGRPLGAPLRGHQTPVEAVAISPDGTHILSGSTDGNLLWWDGARGTALTQPMRAHTLAVLSLAISGDGRTAVSGSTDNRLKVWDLTRGVPREGPTLHGHQAPVTSVAIDQDGRRIISGSLDGTVRVWDRIGPPVSPPVLGRHSGAVWSVAVSPQGDRMASGGDDSRVRLWQHRRLTGSLFSTPARPISVVRFSPDGARLAAAGAAGTLEVWDVNRNRPVVQVPVSSPTNPKKWVLSLAYSPDGRRIATGSLDAGIRVWDASNGKLLLGPMFGHNGGVTSLAYSPDGQLIVSGSYDSRLVVWDGRRGTRIGPPLEGHILPVTSVAVSPDQRTIASASQDRTIRIWDLRSGQPLRGPIHGHHEAVMAVAYSPDGELLASGSEDQSLRLWDVRSHRQIGPALSTGQGPVTSLAFNPNGDWIVTGSKDTRLRLWDITAQRLMPDACDRLRRHQLVWSNVARRQDADLIEKRQQVQDLCSSLAADPDTEPHRPTPDPLQRIRLALQKLSLWLPGNR